MKTLSRRSFVAMAAASALVSSPLFARDHGHHHGESDPSTCHAGTPVPVTPFDSDIPFDLAYIDTMIPHHASVIALSEHAIPHLEDARLLEIATGVVNVQPLEMGLLQAFRLEWYPEEPKEISDERFMEMMMVTMAGSMDGCTPMDAGSMMHDDEMMLMDGDAMIRAFDDAENADLAFIDLVVPHHQMAVRQSQVGLELAEHQELRDLIDAVIEAQTAEITTLLEVRDEIAG